MPHWQLNIVKLCPIAAELPCISDCISAKRLVYRQLTRALRQFLSVRIYHLSAPRDLFAVRHSINEVIIEMVGKQSEKFIGCVVS